MAGARAVARDGGTRIQSMLVADHVMSKAVPLQQTKNTLCASALESRQSLERGRRSRSPSPISNIGRNASGNGIDFIDSAKHEAGLLHCSVSVHRYRFSRDQLIQGIKPVPSKSVR